MAASQTRDAEVSVRAWVAQLVEHSPEEGRVISANLIPGTKSESQGVGHRTAPTGEPL